MTEQPSDSTDDWETAQSAASGDPHAFKSLFDKYGPELFRFLASRLGRDEAEDVLGDVWLNAWQAICQGCYEKKHFRGWIYQIARNLCHDRVRHRVVEVNSQRKIGLYPHSPDLPDSVGELQQRQDDLRDCIERLKSENEDFAAVVVLNLKGLDHRAIADVLGIPIGTSHSRLSKAKPSLRQCMEEKCWT